MTTGGVPAPADEPVGLPTRLLTAARARGLHAVVSFVAIVVAALIAAVPVFWVAGAHPLDAYRALLDGSLGGQNALAETLVSATPLLLAGLSVAVGFQAGLFNIGVEGQLVVGGLTAGAIGAELDLPPVVHVTTALVGGAAVGAAWALVPALLKAWRGVHEVITTIMLNYVAFAVSLYLVSPGGLLVSSTQPSATDRVRPSAELARIWEPTRLHAGVLVAVVITVAVWLFLYRTPAGYGFQMVGANPSAALFHGISPARITVQAMLASGALAGLAGAVEVLGVHRRYFDSFSPGYGFDSIAVALLGLLHPIGVAAAAVFFGILRAGSVAMQSRAGVSRDVITVISGLVVAFAALRVVLESRLTEQARRRLVRRADTPAEEVPA